MGGRAERRRQVTRTLVGGSLATMSLHAPAASAFEARQVEQGRALWSQCAPCHYVDGDGDGRRSPLSGPRAFPHKTLKVQTNEYSQWNTAADIAEFIARRMPANRPGSLSQQESLALAAFILSKNQVQADGMEMTGETAEAVRLDEVLPQRKRPMVYIFGGLVAALLIGAGLVLVRRRRATSS